MDLDAGVNESSQKAVNFFSWLVGWQLLQLCVRVKNAQGDQLRFGDVCAAAHVVYFLSEDIRVRVVVEVVSRLVVSWRTKTEN